MYYYAIVITLACIIVIAMLIFFIKSSKIDEIIDDEETNFSRYCGSNNTLHGNVPDPNYCQRFHLCHGLNIEPTPLRCTENFCYDILSRGCKLCSEVDCGTRLLMD
ncbi:hypothetical protein D1Q00_gp121 [Trichoplusia ni granulovirus LBIV-12]|uniref:Chitin-binding type-2 domain-containing protein n=1 Tax=Trichoplusia ni granulovirus LBIV-12 TaxID=1916701 RepID=A0A1D8QLC3_GVTN|nr:hypothetical protein D1Q00_gp121 [Trichoplusia ni granulovirus LBIV-12]AOW41459.1 hypothetical protein [Trichoplusia ni granulovirus LBIV-12]